MPLCTLQTAYGAPLVRLHGFVSCPPPRSRPLHSGCVPCPPAPFPSSSTRKLSKHALHRYRLPAPAADENGSLSLARPVPPAESFHAELAAHQAAARPALCPLPCCRGARPGHSHLLPPATSYAAHLCPRRRCGSALDGTAAAGVMLPTFYTPPPCANLQRVPRFAHPSWRYFAADARRRARPWQLMLPSSSSPRVQIVRPVSCALLARLRGLATTAAVSNASVASGSGAGGSTQHLPRRFLRTSSRGLFSSNRRRIMESGNNSFADAGGCMAAMRAGGWQGRGVVPAASVAALGTAP